MKIGQQVTLAISREGVTGTVTAVRDDKFQVTWHDEARPSGKPRSRNWYGPEALIVVRPG
jgi:hypothetical protein